MNPLPLLKRLHLYAFLFLSGEIGYGGERYTSAQSAVWRVLVLLCVSYGLLFFRRFPGHLRVATVGYLLLTLHLVVVSYLRYGVAVGSLQYMGISLGFTLIYGGYVACWLARDIRVSEIVGVILGLFFLNQLVLGRIGLHQFNAVDRSTTCEETYYLVLAFAFFGVRYLQTARLTDGLLAGLVAVAVVAFFHRTVWFALGTCGVALLWLMRGYLRQRLGQLSLLLVPVAGLGLAGGLVLLAQKPDLANTLTDSLSDIENANTQGTAGWRHEQRQLYWQRIEQRPLLGWTYEGYDDGELIMDDPEAHAVTNKGTFIHSGYVNALYHYGMAGLLLQYGLLISTLLFMLTRFRPDAGYVALLAFLLTGFVYSWSYQLPPFYWVLLGVGSYMACLVPVRRVGGGSQSAPNGIPNPAHSNPLLTC
jgi:hypothetical protein